MKNIPWLAAYVLALLCLLTVCSPAHAYEMAPFWPEGCAWNATEIIVATEGAKIDGVLTVKEVWKGELKPGQQIAIPELAWFGSDAARRVLYDTKPHPVLHYATEQRMILYLQRGRTKTGDSIWLSANDYFGGNLAPIDSSMVWVEQGKVYEMGQWSNPGSPIMIQNTLTEAQIRATTQSVLAMKRALYQVITVPDKGQRAQALAPFSHSTNRDARNIVWRALGNCGPAALPALRTMLHTAYLPRNYDDILDTFAKADRGNAERYLIHVIKEETAFWAIHSRDLPRGWWLFYGSKYPTGQTPLNRLLDHYDKAYITLEELRFIRSTQARAVVRAYRNIWRAHPPRYDRNGLSDMLTCCSNILNPSP